MWFFVLRSFKIRDTLIDSGGASIREEVCENKNKKKGLKSARAENFVSTIL